MKYFTGHKAIIHKARLKIPALLCLAVMLFYPCILHSAEQNHLPIDIVSDKMEACQDTSVVEFTGNVVANRKDMKILADSIKIFFYPSSGQQDQTDSLGSRIEKIVSTGRVQCITGQRQAFADKAIYSPSDQTMIMTGAPMKLLEGKNQIIGEKLTLFIDQNRAVMESRSDSRVRASFSPGKPPVPASEPGT